MANTKIPVELSSTPGIADSSNATAITITSDENVGIGTSSPTSYGNSQKILVIEDSTSPAIAWSDTGQTRDWFAVAQGSGLYFNYGDGGGSGSASNVTSVLVLDNGGNVGIGTDSPSFDLDIQDTSNTYLNVQATATSGEASLALKGKNSSGTDRTLLFKYDNSDLFRIATASAVDMRFETSDAERMRIHSDGRVNIGGTGDGGKFYVYGDTSGAYLSRFHHDGNNNDRYGLRLIVGADDASTGHIWIRFDDGDGHAQGYMYHDNGSVVINQSDERLKENIIDSPLEGINILKQIQQREFNWKRDTDKTKTIGYIAQELETVYPAAVVAVSDKSGDGVVAPDDDPDNPYKFVAKDRLIDVLIKATQEQQTIIEDLKARIETLEG